MNIIYVIRFRHALIITVFFIIPSVNLIFKTLTNGSYWRVKLKTGARLFQSKKNY